MTTHNSLISKNLRIQRLILLFGCMISLCFLTASRARAHKGFALPPLELRSGSPGPQTEALDGLRFFGLASPAVGLIGYWDAGF